MTTIATARPLALAGRISSPRWRALWIALGALCLLLPMWWLARDNLRAELMAEQRTKAAVQLSTYVNATSQVAQRRFDLLEDLRAFLTIGSQDNVATMQIEPYIGELVASHWDKGVRGLLIAPDGVCSYVYPLAGNEDLLGRRLLQDLPAPARADLLRALQGQRITVSGPEDLGAATGEWVAWSTVYRNGVPWGIVGMRFDPAEVLSEVETDGVPFALELGLRDHNGRMLHGGEEIFAAEPVVAQVPMPDGHLDLAGVPVGGWERTIASTMQMLSATTLLATALFALVIYLVAARQFNLATAVEQRTRELSRVNAQLRADLARRRQMEQEREALRAQLEQHAAFQEKAVMEERRRLARELHDSATQLVYSLGLMSETGLRHLGRGDLVRAREQLSRLAETAQRALKEMRLLVYELRPQDREETGLADLLRQRLQAVESRAGVRADLAVEGSSDLPATVREGLFRVSQEALNNALKHAAATTVRVGLRLSEHLAELTIQDDGRGFDLASAGNSGGLGLTSMRERVEGLGGALSIDSRPGRGTAIHVQVPLTRLAVDGGSTRAAPVRLGRCCLDGEHSGVHCRRSSRGQAGLAGAHRDRTGYECRGRSG